jgi:hypothetical protein
VGGSGSGHRGGKATTSTYEFIDITRWRREDRLHAEKTFFCWMRMTGPRLFGLKVSVHDFCLGVEPARFDGREMTFEPSIVVWLERTPCNYGGQRTWFGCSGCERRATKLYIVRRFGEPTRFRCRHCLDLVYASQQLSRKNRCSDRASTLRIALGGSQSLADPLPAKPKGMHWRTYLRKCQRIERNESVVFGALGAWLERCGQR